MQNEPQEQTSATPTPTRQKPLFDLEGWIKGMLKPRTLAIPTPEPNKVEVTKTRMTEPPANSEPQQSMPNQQDERPLFSPIRETLNPERFLK